MIVEIKVIDDGGRLSIVGQVDNHIYPPVRMPRGMIRPEAELEAVRRFLRRRQDWRYVTFVVDPYVADVASFRRNPTCLAVEQAANRVDYLVRRRSGPVRFVGRT